MLHRALLTALTICLAPAALAEMVQIDGPAGPLSAEQIRVDGAKHAVVIVPGSGPIDRDGNIPQVDLASDSYKLLAEGLEAKGIASLRIDKRGFFSSAEAISDPNDVTIADYAADTRNWVNLAAGLAPCVWIAGHSEGGLVALVAAQEPPEALCGLILMATPGRTVSNLMREQIKAQPQMRPLMPQLEATLVELEAGRTSDPEELHPALRPMFEPGLQRYMINLFSYDPAVIAQDWAGPALILYGAADIQVKPEDANLLDAALAQGEEALLPNATHMLKEDVPGAPYATYSDPSLPLHGGVIPAITAFIERNDTTQ